MRLLTCFGVLLTLAAACEGPVGPPGPQGPPGKDGTRTAPLEAAGAPASECVSGEMSTPGGAHDPCSQDNPQCVALKGRGVAICSGGAWGQCVCMAPKPDTSPGAAGSSSVGYQPIFWADCHAARDLINADGLNETLLAYTVTGFSNHDLDVSCTAALSSNSASQSRYLPSVIDGARDGACIAGLDFPPSLPGSENGWWKFSIVVDGAAGGPIAQYNDVDPGHPLNGFTYRFTESNCAIYVRRSADAEWTNAALSDVFD